MSIGIVDNDCPELVKPLNGVVSLPYSQTNTKTHCDVVCDPGYRMVPMGETLVSDAADTAASSASKLTCNKATGTWDRQLPDCKFCAAGYFNASGTCLPCSSSQCPAGRYRAACTPQSDAICKMCNVSTKPSYARWTPGDVSLDGNGCNWTCDVGYLLSSTDISENVTFQDAAKLCIKLPSKDVRDDPIDTDQDGIPDVSN